MPPPPRAIRARLLSRGLSHRDVDVLMSIDAGAQVPFDGEMGAMAAIAYFDEAAKGRVPKTVANWLALHSLQVVPPS